MIYKYNLTCIEVSSLTSSTLTFPGVTFSRTVSRQFLNAWESSRPFRRGSVSRQLCSFCTVSSSSDCRLPFSSRPHSTESSLSNPSSNCVSVKWASLTFCRPGIEIFTSWCWSFPCRRLIRTKNKHRETPCEVNLDAHFLDQYLLSQWFFSSLHSTDHFSYCYSFGKSDNAIHSFI